MFRSSRIFWYPLRMEDILLIDKPAGVTSFDVLRRLRKKLGMVKMGHAGTLDPMATGLMIVGIGEGTKKLKEYLKLPKVYEAEVMLGIKTTTGDREGEVIESANIKYQNVAEGDIHRTLLSIVGKIVLPVPMYSAVKVGGKRLYARARKGEVFDTPKKEMEVVRLTFGGIKNVEYGIEGGELSSASADAQAVAVKKAMEGKQESGVVMKFEVEVTSGTYVRSLAEEIGKRLGVPVTLWNLRRMQIGKFRIENAEKL